MLFSIIIPIYNSSLVIKRCLSSIINQSWDDFELILIDDGSKDESEIVAREILAETRFTRFKYIHKENGGAGSARNLGLSIAVGQYVVFVDSDDYLDIAFLEHAAELIKKDNSDIVFINIIREDSQGRIIRYEKLSDYITLSKERFLRNQLTGKIPWGGVRKIVRRSILEDNNIRFATIKVGEEAIYSFKALDRSKRVSFLTDVYYHYVENNSSLTSIGSVQNTLMVFENIIDAMNESGDYESYSDTLNALAYMTLAICLNILSQQTNIKEATLGIKEISHNCLNHVHGAIDFEALDHRVKLCLPMLKIGFFLPIICFIKVQTGLSRRDA